MTGSYITPLDPPVTLAPGWYSLAIPPPEHVPIDDEDDDDYAAELKARIPDGCHIAEHWEDENCVTYFFPDYFEVDGIEYRYATNHIRPMFSIEEQASANNASRMTFSRPTTDAELDYWVRAGKPLPRKG